MQNTAPLLFRNDLDRLQQDLRVVDDGGNDAFKVSGPTLDRSFLKSPGTILKAEHDPLIMFDSRQCEIKFGFYRLPAERSDFQSRQVKVRFLKILDHEQHVEKGIPAYLPVDLQRPKNILIREIPVIETP